MPKIELVLPGENKTQVEPVAEVYRITIERGDGMACSEIEARTAMGMFCMSSPKAKRKKVKTGD
jgi:hypothetical protein